MGNAGAKTAPHKLLKAVAKKLRVLSKRQMLPACGHSKLPWSLQDFLTEDEADDEVRGGNSGADAAKTQNENRGKSHRLAGGFQTFSFSG